MEVDIMKEQKNRLVVANADWAKDAPDWLLKEIESERIVQGFAGVLGKGKEEVGDAEVCLYLYTLGLTVPMDYEFTQIYLHLASKLMAQRGVEVPKDIKVTELSSDAKRELERLKRELYRKRGGEIKSPLFEILKAFKKQCKKSEVGTNGIKTRNIIGRNSCFEISA
jgi:hypothetical protein